MSKNLKVKVGKAFRYDSPDSPAVWLERCVSSILSEEGARHYKPTIIKIYDREDAGDDESRMLWVEVKLKRNAETTHYSARVICTKPEQFHETESRMNGVTCETDFDEVIRSNILKWKESGIGVVIVKNRYRWFPMVFAPATWKSSGGFSFISFLKSFFTSIKKYTKA